MVYRISDGESIHQLPKNHIANLTVLLLLAARFELVASMDMWGNFRTPRLIWQ